MPTAGTTLAENPFQRAAWGRVLGQTRPHVAPWARQVRFCAAFLKGFCETHPSSIRRAGSRTSTSPDTVHRRLAAGVSSNSIDWGSCACGQERRPGKRAMPDCQKQCNKNTAGRGGARSTQYFACPQSSVSVMVSSKHRSRFATTGCSGSLRQRPAQAIANKIQQCLHVGDRPSYM